MESAIRGLQIGALLSIVAVSLATPSPAPAHEGESHQALDEITRDVAGAPKSDLSGGRSLAAGPVGERAAVGPKSEIGEWGPVVDWPVVGVFTALLPNGKVLAFDSVDFANSDTHDHTRATVWDPATGAHIPAWVQGHNIFCAGLAHLPDGSIFTAGGNVPGPPDGYNGIVQTYTFNHTTNAWALGPDMAAPRWYPSVTPLANGEMLITDGTIEGAEEADTPEVRMTSGALRSLLNATIDLEWYPWIDVAPDGRAFYSGPGRFMRTLDTTGNGSWQTHHKRDDVERDYGSRALYDVGKILVAGGEASQSSAMVIDFNEAIPQSTPTASMAYGRRQHTLTVLADGSVLATGGNSSGAGLVDLDNGVYDAELWNPQTGQWTTLDAMAVTRQYHSTALLLPDGRVLSLGGGICGDCEEVGYLAQNAEIFTPPYLFKQDGSGELASRPAIEPVADLVNYATALDISSVQSASISKVALLRLGAVTHSVNMEQRYVPLTFTTGTGMLTATTPSSVNIAPPGVYMLIAIDSAGVPSVAKMIRLAADAPPVPRLPVPVAPPSPAPASPELPPSPAATVSPVLSVPPAKPLASVKVANVASLRMIMRNGRPKSVAITSTTGGRASLSYRRRVRGKLKLVHSQRKSISAGRTSIRPGRLRRGTYRLTLTVKDPAGGVSAPKAVAFKVR